MTDNAELIAALEWADNLGDADCAIANKPGLMTQIARAALAARAKEPKHG